MTSNLARAVFEMAAADTRSDGGLTGDARASEPSNFLRHVLALTSSKVADGLINPKLVLSWLVIQLGAGTFWAGLLVPVREAGALLPQLFTAGAIHGLPRRRNAWAYGAIGQGIAAAGIVAAGLTLDGGLAGAVIVGLLGVLALSRSVCSVAYKDVLGKTIGKRRRGTATGLASSISSVAVVLFAIALMLQIADRYVLVIAAVVLASAAWLIAGLVFFGIEEESSPGKRLGAWASVAQLRLLRDDPQLRRFVIVRSLLVGTALAPPYLVTLGSGGNGLETLGALVLASAVASLASSFVWGRLSDKSSRWVLILSGVSGAAALAAAVLFGTLKAPWILPAILFVLMIAYHGVRQGRSTYLVDMARPSERAAFTAVANTSVGVFLLAMGAAYAAMASYSVPLVLGLMIVMCLAGAAFALGLDEVEDG